MQHNNSSDNEQAVNKSQTEIQISCLFRNWCAASLAGDHSQFKMGISDIQGV